MIAQCPGRQARVPDGEVFQEVGVKNYLHEDSDFVYPRIVGTLPIQERMESCETVVRIHKTSWPYFGVKFSCVFLMFTLQKKGKD